MPEKKNAETNSSTPPIDRQEVLERIGGDEDFLKELIDIYKQEFAEKAELLAKAIEEKNFQVIREAGHSLKGASANLSLPALREAAWEMEMAGKEQNLEQAQKALTKLKKEYQRLLEYLG
ncbi:MAG: Hpt domain-containing protein [Candidatus Aminicenantes bacterium]|nr:Hpt domain-containing protein [Candidatus Aminicenantes bacterium]